MTFTYGTEDVVKTLELRDKDENLLETEELSDVSQVDLNVTCDNPAIQVTPKIVEQEAESRKTRCNCNWYSMQTVQLKKKFLLR